MEKSGKPKVASYLLRSTPQFRIKLYRATSEDYGRVVAFPIAAFPQLHSFAGQAELQF